MIVGQEYCPVSGTYGRPVELPTVKALLTEQALARLHVAAHRFCPDAACEIVYFDALGNTYAKTDVRVPVWQKEPFGARTVCYCFGEGEAAMRREIESTCASAAEQRVRAHIEAGRCACEIRNPRGVCCLGDVAAAVARVTAAVAATEPRCRHEDAC